jgi:DNA-binding response OmpR family regulator
VVNSSRNPTPPTDPNRARLRGTVLIIDDDPRIRSLMAERLLDEGFAVEQAADSVTGLRVSALVQPDVIVLDLALPKHSGPEVLEQLRQQHPTREIPVVIVDTYALVAVRDKAGPTYRPHQAPFDLKELLGTVREIARTSNDD